MWAELVLSHEPMPDSSILEMLIPAFGEHDPDALRDSENFSGANWKDTALYVRSLASYRILGIRDGDNETVFYIESIRGTAFGASQSAWKRLRRAMSDSKPALNTADIVEAANSPRFVRGQCTSVLQELRKRESLGPMSVGVLTSVYFSIAMLTYGAEDKLKYAQGLAAGLIAITVVLALAALEASKRKIRWTTKDVD